MNRRAEHPTAAVTMLERVARALAAEDLAQDIWDRLPDDWADLGRRRKAEGYEGNSVKAEYLQEARTAIAAMREPTEAMARAAEEGPLAIYLGNQGDDCVVGRAAWTAMIDEALKP